MFDPVTVAGTAALAEGVRFLYGQLTDVLKRHRDQSASASSTTGELDSELIGLPGRADPALDGRLRDAHVPVAELERVVPALRELRGALADYRDELSPISPNDQDLPQLLGQARGLLEGLYRQHLTLAGEAGRPSTGTTLSDDEAATRVQAVVASGTGAVAAHTISGQVATAGGIAVGGALIGDVHGQADRAERY